MSQGDEQDSLPFVATWEKAPAIPSMSTPRCGFGAVVAKDQIIVIGGSRSGPSPTQEVLLPTLECISVDEDDSNDGPNSWRQLPRMKTVRGGFDAACVKGTEKFLIAGGYVGEDDPTKTAMMFDLDTNTWSDFPPMAIARKECASAACPKGLLTVVAGGTDGTNVLSSVERYDSEKQEWAMLPANMTTGRRLCGAVVLSDQRVVVLGGYVEAKGGDPTHTVEIYDNKTQKWRLLPPMSKARADFAAVAVDDSVFVFGGKDENNDELKCAEYLNIAGECKWKPLPPMSVERVGCRAVALDAKIVVLGGFAGKIEDPNSLYNSVEILVFQPSMTLVPKLPPLVLANDFGNKDWLCKAIDHWCTGASALISKTVHDGDVVKEKVQKTALRRTKCLRKARDKRLRELEFEAKNLENEINAVKEAYEVAEADVDKFFVRRANDISDTVSGWVGRANDRVKRARLLAPMDDAGEGTRLLFPSETKAEGGDAAAANEASGPKPPFQLVCPLTFELMVDPVVADDGHSYERSAIERWFSNFPADQQPTSPTTDVVLASRRLQSNATLKSMCDAFRAKKKEEKEVVAVVKKKEENKEVAVVKKKEEVAVVKKADERSSS